MTTALSILIRADGKAAQAELQKLSASADKAGLSVQSLGKKGTATDAEIAALNAELAKASAQVEVLTSSEAKAVAQMAQMQAQVDQINARFMGMNRSAPMAAGSISNLTAQFNDLGVMLAAGQNPFQLAIQQGTQITQVIGPMGARGAVRALGTAFLSLLSPVNLVTLGVIAGGAALVQWAFKVEDAEEKTLTFAEKVDEAAAAIGRAEQAAAFASMGGLEDMRAKYGEISDQVLALSERLFDIERRAAVAKVSIVLDDATGEKFDTEIERIAGAVGAALAGAGSQANAEQLELARKNLRDIEAEIATMSFANQFTGDLEKQAGIYRNEIAALEGDLGNIGALAQDLSISPDFAREIAEIRASISEALSAGDLGAVADQIARMQAALKESGATIDQDVADGLTRAEDLARQAAAQLAEGKANAEGLANAGMASAISAARSEASRLADELVRAFEASASLSAQGVRSVEEAQLRLDLANEPVELARQLGVRQMQQTQGVRREGATGAELAALDAEAVAYGNLMAQEAELNQQRSERLKKTRSSGAETDAVRKLIEQEQLQLDLLRETDPVQKEMIRNRETLASATETERAEVEALIRTRIEENDALTSLTQQQEFYAQTAYDAIDGLVFRGQSLADTFASVADMIGQAVLKAALLGEGPLAGMFGTSSGGGLLGTLFSGLTGGLQARAEGGYVHGPGGAKSDDVLMWASAGEYVMNARATRQNRHLLESLNAGGLPAFAQGGLVGGAGAASGSPRLVMPAPIINNFGTDDVDVDVQPDSKGQPQLVMTVGRQAAAAVAQRGNPLRRTMQNEFGLRPTTRNRG
ncbi:phage tail length tape measure family protein [Oceanicola sp. S124]|uniref:phage tail length tape measure family protein n=1 Tax=Oceanicola sp. S124 TaxID=1042378 RepID=UPI0002558667|nr:phage tail length tape measure family protein [Oceanicola sp. S124]